MYHLQRPHHHHHQPGSFNRGFPTVRSGCVKPPSLFRRTVEPPTAPSPSASPATPHSPFRHLQHPHHRHCQPNHHPVSPTPSSPSASPEAQSTATSPAAPAAPSPLAPPAAPSPVTPPTAPSPSATQASTSTGALPPPLSPRGDTRPTSETHHTPGVRGNRRQQSEHATTDTCHPPCRTPPRNTTTTLSPCFPRQDVGCSPLPVGRRLGRPPGLRTPTGSHIPAPKRPPANPRPTRARQPHVTPPRIPRSHRGPGRGTPVKGIRPHRHAPTAPHAKGHLHHTGQHPSPPYGPRELLLMRPPRTPNAPHDPPGVEADKEGQQRGGARRQPSLGRHLGPHHGHLPGSGSHDLPPPT